MDILPIGTVLVMISVMSPPDVPPGWKLITGTTECLEHIADKHRDYPAVLRTNPGMHFECFKRVEAGPTS